MTSSELVQTIDARIWAREFVKIFTKTRLLRAGISEQDMIGWFANSIMAGFDEARRRDRELIQPQIDELKHLIRKETLIEAGRLITKNPFKSSLEILNEMERNYESQ